jgi:hypothetical protein
MRMGFLSISAILSLSILLPATSEAQLRELTGHYVNGPMENIFLCDHPGPTDDIRPCNLWNRIYGDLNPTEINSPAILQANPDWDPFPIYRPRPLRYAGPIHSTGHFPDASGSGDACEAWYSAWTGVTSPSSPLYVSYYGAGSTIANFWELGNLKSPDCTGGNVELGVCIGALSPETATGSSPDTPAGDLVGHGGMEPVPVPRIVAGDTGAGRVELAWSSPENINTVNLPSANAVPCPIGSTFDDLTETSGPPPILGVRLFAHALDDGAQPPSLAAMEGGSVDAQGIVDVLGEPGQNICHDDATCPLAHVIPCFRTQLGACAADGIDFLPVSQSVEITNALVDLVLGDDGPVGESRLAVFNIKVVFAGATATANPYVPEFKLNPYLVSLFSAHSHPVRFTPTTTVVELADQPNLESSTALIITWSASGAIIDEFRLQRSTDGARFQEVAAIPGTTETDYSYTDVILGDRPETIYYRLVTKGADGSMSEIVKRYALSSDSRDRSGQSPLRRGRD